MAGVVDARGHFIGDECVALDEEFDREDADIVESFEKRAQVRFGFGLQRWIVERRDGGAQNARAMDVFGERIEGDVAAPVAGGDERNFPVETHHAFENAGCAAGVGPGGGGLVDVRETDLAAAVVAEATGLEDGWRADGVEGVVEIAQAIDGSVRCRGNALLAEEVLFEQTVLRDGDGASVGVEVET